MESGRALGRRSASRSRQYPGSTSRSGDGQRPSAECEFFDSVLPPGYSIKHSPAKSSGQAKTRSRIVCRQGFRVNRLYRLKTKRPRKRGLYTVSDTVTSRFSRRRQHPQCGHPHESQNASHLPSQSEQSTPPTTSRYPQASPSPCPQVTHTHP